MGIISSQDVFQMKIDSTFGNIPGVFSIADDLVMAGYREDGTDHDATLRAVLQCTLDHGVKFKKDKMVVRCKQIPFYGQLIGKNGIEPDPRKSKRSTLCSNLST